MGSETIVCSAPGRAGILGNPTDMYGGSVISCATRERARVTIQPADRLVFRNGPETLLVAGAGDLQLKDDHFDIVRAVLTTLKIEDLKADIGWTTEIPFRAGLSGSTALLVAILNGLLAFQGKRHNRYYLAELARHIEYQTLQVVCGYQDAYMCTFGGLHYMDFRDKEFYRDLTDEPYTTMESLAPHIEQLPFILAHSGVQRVSGTVHKPIRERWLEGDPEVVEAYNNLGRIARMGKKALLHEQWETLGSLMNENHAITRELGGSGPANERLIQAALEHGALGAKLAGAGKGGTIIALHLQPEALRGPLLQAGAEAIFCPRPGPGVQVEHLE